MGTGKVFLVLYSIIALGYCKKKLYIGGYFPIDVINSPNWACGGCLLVAQMALQHIKNRTDLLQDYDLVLLPQDVSCSGTNVLRVFVNDIVTSPVKIAILGPGCSSSTTSMNIISRFYNIMKMCYGSASMMLSDNDDFPLFVRTAAPESVNNPARVAIARKFSWKRVGILRNDHDFTTVLSNDLKKKLEGNGIHLITEEIFQTNPEFHIQVLKERDVRIIYGFIYENEFRKALCEAYKIGFYGDDIVWINYAYYRPKWYSTVDKEVTCSPEQLKVAAGNYITVIAYLQNMDNTQPTICGLTGKQLWTDYHNLVTMMNESKYDFNEWAGNAYDGMWSLALMINKSLPLLSRNGLDLMDFSYQNAKYADIFSSVVHNISFLGMSGPVSFDSNGDRVTISVIRQMQGDYEKEIAYYDRKNSSLRYIDERSFTWPGRELPRDGFITNAEKIYSIPTVMTSLVTSLATVGLLCNLVFVVYLLKHRRTRSVKTPGFALIMIAICGCALFYVSVIVLGLQHNVASSQSIKILCKVFDWIITYAFALTYSPLLLWKARMYFHFTRRIKVLTPSLMLVFTFAFTLIYTCVLLVRDVIDSPNVNNVVLSDDVDKTKGVKTVLVHYYCSRNHDLAWQCIVYGYTSLLLLQGAFFTLEARNIAIPSAHDATTSAMAIYVIILSCTVVIPLQKVLENKPDVHFALSGVLTISSSSLVIGLVIIPKILRIRAEIKGDLIDDIFLEEPPTRVSLKSTANSVSFAGKLKRRKFDLKKKKVHPEAIPEVT